MKIVVNLSPCDVKKSGSHFDLGMAVGLLIQSKQLCAGDLSTFGFIGELSLNADLRPCSGVLPMVIEAKKRGITNLIVPRRNLREASLVNGINIFGFENLKEVVDFIEGTNTYKNVEDFKDEHLVRLEHRIIMLQLILL